MLGFELDFWDYLTFVLVASGWRRGGRSSGSGSPGCRGASPSRASTPKPRP